MNNKGFTLVELMVVVAIAATLASIALSVLTQTPTQIIEGVY